MKCKRLSYLISFGSSLNENVAHRHKHLSTWSLVGCIVWEVLGGVVLMGKVCHWGPCFEGIQPCSPSHLFFLLSAVCQRCDLSSFCSHPQVCCLVLCFPTMMDSCSSGSTIQNETSSSRVTFGDGVRSLQQKVMDTPFIILSKTHKALCLVVKDVAAFPFVLGDALHFFL